MSEKSTLSKVRHDLRTPINHILGYSELLAEDLRDQGINDLTDLDKIQLAARQLLGLIDSSLSGDDVSLPAEKQSVAAEAKPVKILPASEAANDNPAPIAGHILVVDDNLDNREVLAKRLQRQGHTVVQAEDGEQALALLRKEKFDLALLDMIMPVMDGYTALLQMKEDAALRHIPVIMISALDEIESVARCIEAGAEDYLPKPFNPTVLRARIGASLEKKAFRDQEQAYLARIEETQKRLEEELQEAGRYVESILPPPMDEPFRITWAYDPSTELGGDSFGYHWLDETHFAIYLLDVCGHGVGAALLSVAAINVMRTASLPHVDFKDPAQVLSALNESFQMERHNNMYFTLWYGVYNTVTRTLCHASGGHPPALLLHQGEDGKDMTTPLRHPGMLIGAMPGAKYGSGSIVIPGNSRLFVYCDGAYEIKRKDGEMLDFDEDFVAHVVEHGRDPNLPDEILAWVRGIHGHATLDDDYSFVAIDFA